MTNPSTTNTYIHCRVSAALAAGLQDCAKQDNTSASEIMRQAFKEYLASRGYDVPVL